MFPLHDDIIMVAQDFYYNNLSPIVHNHYMAFPYVNNVDENIYSPYDWFHHVNVHYVYDVNPYLNDLILPIFVAIIVDIVEIFVHIHHVYHIIECLDQKLHVSIQTNKQNKWKSIGLSSTNHNIIWIKCWECHQVWSIRLIISCLRHFSIQIRSCWWWWWWWNLFIKNCRWRLLMMFTFSVFLITPTVINSFSFIFSN